MLGGKGTLAGTTRENKAVEAIHVIVMLQDQMSGERDISYN